MPTGIPLDAPKRIGFLDSNYYPANESRDIAINSSENLVAIWKNNTDPIVIMILVILVIQLVVNFSVDWYTRGLEFINDTTFAFGKAIQGLKIVTIGDSSTAEVSELIVLGTIL